MRIFSTLLFFLVLVSCSQKKKTKNELIRFIQIEPDSNGNPLTNSYKLHNKCYDVDISKIKYCIWLNDSDKVINTSVKDTNFISFEGVRIGMKYSEVELLTGLSSKYIITGKFTYYLPLRNGWYAGFILDEDTESKTNDKDSVVAFFFKRQ